MPECLDVQWLFLIQMSIAFLIGLAATGATLLAALAFAYVLQRRFG